MDVNVTALEIRRSGDFVSLSIQNDVMVREGKEQEDNGRYYGLGLPIRVLLSPGEVKHMIAALRDEAEFYPWFDDLSYLLRPSNMGLRLMVLSGSGDSSPSWEHRHRELWFEMPGGWLALKIEEALEQEDGWTWAATAEELAELRLLYAGRVEMQWGEGTQADFEMTVADGRQEGLLQQYDRLYELALRRSHGKPSRFYMSIDPWERTAIHAYAWRIEDGEGRRVSNGLLYPHPDGENKWSYSCHT